MKLTKEDWVEIYAALESKERLIERGDYGEGDHPSDNDKWRAHLNLIMEKIGGDGQEACNSHDELVGMVKRIHAILDSPVEWDSETIEHVAEVLTDNGYVIRDPNEPELFSERERETGVRDITPWPATRNH